MAKTSSVEKNNYRRRLVAQKAAKRKRLKEIANDLKRPAEERFAARLKLAEMPRNSSAVTAARSPAAPAATTGSSRCAATSSGSSPRKA